jgi:hypothetical protein
VADFLWYLTLTLALEAPLYWLLLSYRPPRERIAFWLAANIFSYPAVYFFFPRLDQPAWICELLAEIWAPSCEIAVGLIILPRPRWKDVAVVIAANLFSWLVGKGLFLSQAL